MAKQQFNVGVPNITRRQVEKIAKCEGMTLGEVVAMAVDRLYQAEYRPQENGKEELKI